MAFKWNDSLATGIDKVDEQHKELIKRTNNLLEHMRQGLGHEEIMKTVQFLSSYVVEHFTDEESVMKTYNYPVFKEHKKQHDDFIKSVEVLAKKMENEKFLNSLILEVNRSICDWLINHILKEDKVMAQYVQEQRKIKVASV